MYNYFKNIFEENRSQEFRLKKLDEKRNYFAEEIDQIEFMNKKRKKVRPAFSGY